MRREWSLREGPRSYERKMVVSVEIMNGLGWNHGEGLEERWVQTYANASIQAASY